MLNSEFDKTFFNWLLDEISNSPTLSIKEESMFSCKNHSLWNENFAKLEKLYGYLLSKSHLDLIDSHSITFKYDEYFYEMGYIHSDYHPSLLVTYVPEKPEEYIDLNKTNLEKKKYYRALYVLVNPSLISEKNKMREISNLITKSTIEYISKNPHNEEVKAWMNSECKVVLLEADQRHMESWHFVNGGYFKEDKDKHYKYITIGIVERANAAPLLQQFKPVF